jgi:hypothetical protein
MKTVKMRAGKKRKVDTAEHEEHKRILKQQEIENYDKLTKNLVREHEKLSKRLELVANPQYVFDLREKVEEMKNYVRELKNNQRLLEKNQKNRDKKLNYMINKGGEVGHLRKINDTQNELAVTRNQLAKVTNKLQKLEETKQHNQEQISQLNDKLSKLQSVAQKHSINIDQVAKDVEKKHNYEDFAEIKKELLRKKNVMENAIKVQKKKYQQLFIMEKRRYEEITKEKQEMTVLLQDREKEAQKQGKAIDELKIKYEQVKKEAELNNFMKNESEKQESRKDRSEIQSSREHSRQSRESKNPFTKRKSSKDESELSDDENKQKKSPRKHKHQSEDEESEKRSQNSDKSKNSYSLLYFLSVINACRTKPKR